MEEESVPLRKSGLLKCHSRFRGLSFKIEDFSPSSSPCLFAPFSVYVLSSCTPVFIVHPHPHLEALKNVTMCFFTLAQVQ